MKPKIHQRAFSQIKRRDTRKIEIAWENMKTLICILEEKLEMNLKNF